jgi:hypothetical protein
MNTLKNEIQQLREKRGTYRNDGQCNTEAEVLAMIEHLSAFVSGQNRQVYFVSQSHILDKVGGLKPVKWSPECLYRYVSALPTSTNDPALFSQCLLDTYYASGITVIDTKSYRKFFGASINQARTEFEKQKQEYIRTLEKPGFRVNPQELEEAFERTPDFEKPLFVTQMGWKVAREKQREIESGQVAIQQSLALVSEANKRADDAQRRSEEERKRRLTLEHENNRLRNLNDPNHQKKREWQARKRRRKTR